MILESLTTEDKAMENEMNLRHLFEYQIRLYEYELKKVEDELDEIGRDRRSIIVKRIKGIPYYYLQHRDGNKIISTEIGKVYPGSAAKEESKVSRRNELLRQREVLLGNIEILKEGKKKADKQAIETEFNDRFSFEVFWKDTLSARVSVNKSRVHVSRYIDHPVRQLFWADNITRDQLNHVLKLRCIDENRPDINEKLKHWGLEFYNPLEIVKKTHGVSFNDYLWFRFPGENIISSDVLVRGKNV